MITNMANLALVDKAATPVTHQFTPAPIVGLPGRWADREHNGGLAIGYSTIALRIKEPTGGNGLYRVTVDYAFPKVDTTVPAKPAVVAIPRAKLEFTFPDVLNDQERKDIIQLVYSSLAQGSAAALGDNIAYQLLPY